MSVCVCVCVCVMVHLFLTNTEGSAGEYFTFLKAEICFLKLHNETVVLLSGGAGSHPDACSSV